MRLGVILFCTVGMALGVAQAADAPVPPGSCGYFSPDAADINGPPVLFYADLSADEESMVTESPGKGRIDFSLDRKTLTFSWKLTYSGLTSPATGAHIHGPQTPGGEAGVLHDLAPKGLRSPLEGSAVLTDGEVTYLIQDRFYVNLHTEKYPQGEIRGSVHKIRQTC